MKPKFKDGPSGPNDKRRSEKRKFLEKLARKIKIERTINEESIYISFIDKNGEEKLREFSSEKKLENFLTEQEVEMYVELTREEYRRKLI